MMKNNLIAIIYTNRFGAQNRTHKDKVLYSSRMLKLCRTCVNL